MKSLMRMMSEYNRWANVRLLEDCAAVNGDDLFKDLGVEYGSIHGTLDHALLIDRRWLARFLRQQLPLEATAAQLTSSFSRLEVERGFTDEDLIRFVDGLSEADLLGRIEFTTIRSPQKVVQPLSSALLHLFQNQSHHRGQVQTLLQILGQEPRTLDLLHFQLHTRLGGVVPA